MQNSVFTKLAPYIQITKMGGNTNFVYRSNIVFQLAGVILQIYLLKIVWTALYTQRGVVNHEQLQFLLSYLTMTNLQVWVLTPTMIDYLQQRIRTGAIAIDIAQPISLPRQLTVRQLGATLSLIPLAILALPIAYFAGGILLPASPEAAVLYLISCFFSYSIVSLIGLLLGLLSLWTFEVTGLQLLYRFINQLFAGALIPLWLFPPALHTIASFLPFQAIASLPVLIYLGRLQGMAILNALATQLFWVVILYLLARYIWHRAQHYLIIQGG